ncbi:energy-coupling factor transporter ATP-binding protein EcfA2 [Actinokineospora baliensis]|uniref:ATP-binding protein n=1 Tax=Actinokineospora baliensis TaxID=547056 RepID=UPI00195A8A95|nr:ATP-binding protein [Actinokineospora baliensis]MBM7774083.1 energy-coupling factor transporter ATP-binding protein EcfA2 [Actinokineospora baliensis]
MGQNITVQGSTYGSVVAGNYNVLVDARHGSSVTVEVERERPDPVRRERISVLPRRGRVPIGRGQDVDRLAAAIADGGLVRLSGPAGIGKSTLLRHVARTVECDPDGVVFVSAAHRQVGDLAQEIFEACYHSHGYAPSRSGLRELMTGLRITVYVDDADLGVDQLRELTDLVPDATFVLAGRDCTPLGDATAHRLGGLPQDIALLLLAQGLGRPLRGAEQETAADLWRAADGNPLLLLRAAGVDQSKLPAPGAVSDLLPLLLDAVGPTALDILNVLSTLRDAELSTVHIGALAGEPEVGPLCERLSELGLVTPGEHGYRPAPGVAAALRRREVAAVPFERLCAHFTEWAADPGTMPERVAEHSRAIERSAGLAIAGGAPHLAVDLGRAASPKLAHSLRFDAWGETLRRGWTGADRAGDTAAKAYFAHEEGIRSLVTGKRLLAAVLLAQAVTLWRTLGQHQGTNAAAGAQQFLPAPSDIPDLPLTDGGDTPELVMDHMTGFEQQDPTVDTIDFPNFPDGVAESTLVPPDPAAHTPTADPVYATTPPDPSAVSNVVAPPSAPVAPAASVASAAPQAATAAGAAASSSLLSPIMVIIAAVVGIAILNNSDLFQETGIAGTWQDSRSRFEVQESGSGSYEITTTCGDVIRLTGTDSSASGKLPMREGSCGSLLGYGEFTMSITGDPDTASISRTMADNDEYYCSTCGSDTATRVE